MRNLAAPIIIGIAGGTGSGKSRLARLVCEQYAGAGAAVIDQDAYYVDRSHLSADERRSINYDEPGAVDHETLARHLDEIRRGLTVHKPRYCFATHTRDAATDRVPPAPLVVVEGLFALWDGAVRAQLALKVFVDTDAELRFIRRLRRDVTKRGRSIDDVVEQYLASVRPMHWLHIEPTRAFADLVVSGEHVDAALPAIRVAVDGLLGAPASISLAGSAR